MSSKPRPIGWEQRRQRLDEVGSIWPVADDVELRTVDCGNAAGEWSLSPGADATRVLLYFHGGGYCSGSIASHRRLVTEAGRAAGISTLAIAYRLAPEHPFPAAHDDAMVGWRYLRQQGIDARNIVVGGDSAGGNLTITLINALREANEDLPACAWLISPWTDLTMSGKTLESKDHIDPIIHHGYLVELADAYAPTSLDRRNPLLSPLFSALVGFPPTLIQVGSAETLLSDSTRFAEVAAEANVATTLEVWPEMIHAWPLWNAGLTDARLALKSAGQFMKRRLLDRIP
ncbi:MAG TPA: alpha/beta hydrolase [Nitrosospira sp.]|nr:alpha/beta hydrolase [Nitrosospira sp.]